MAPSHLPPPPPPQNKRERKKETGYGKNLLIKKKKKIKKKGKNLLTNVVGFENPESIYLFTALMKYCVLD